MNPKMKNAERPFQLILPERIAPSLGMDGRHHAVPLMAKDERFENDENEPFHPRLGHISHGHGHATQAQAEALAKEISHRYNVHAALIKTLQDIHLLAADAQLRATYQKTALEQISAKAQEILKEV